MLLPVQQYTTKYNYGVPVSFGNKTVPSFKSAGDIIKIEKRLYDGVQKLENQLGNHIVFGLAMAGLAAITGLYKKFENSDVIKLLTSKIQTPGRDIVSEITTISNEQPLSELVTTEETHVSEKPNAEEHVTEPVAEDVAEDVAEIKKEQKRKGVKIVTEEDIRKQFERFIEEKPERKDFFIYLEGYPDILRKYKNIIRQRVTDECDETNRNNLKGIENILRRIPELEKGYINAEDDAKRVNPTELLKSLNTVYFDDFEDICSMIYKEQDLYDNTKGRKIFKILDSIAQREFNAADIKKYLEYPNLTYCEYASIQECGREDLLQYFNDIKDFKDKKDKYNIIECRLVKSKQNDEKPDFAIKFDTGISVNKRLKVIVEIFEKIHGKVTLNTGKINGNGIFNVANLYDELHFRLRKDDIIIPLYNFAKFVDPEAMKEYNYTEKELLELNPEEDKPINPKYIDLKRKIGSVIAYLEGNNKCKEIIEVINDKVIFQDCIDNLHAILRFICRFVINKNYNSENGFRNECKKQADLLKSSLGYTTRNSTLIQAYCYNYKKGIAPRFYLKDDCKLGPNISVTLNNEGAIHTIFKNLPAASGRKCREED